MKCTCALFELRSILCMYSIYMLLTKKVIMLPKRYFLDRWWKDLKRRHTMLKSSIGAFGGNPNAERHDRMCKNFDELASLISDNVDHSMEVMKHVNILNEKLCALRREPNHLSHHISFAVTSSSCIEVVQSNDGLAVQSNKVLSLVKVKCKGKPLLRRNVPMVEKVAKNS